MVARVRHVPSSSAIAIGCSLVLASFYPAALSALITNKPFLHLPTLPTQCKVKVIHRSNASDNCQLLLISSSNPRLAANRNHRSQPMFFSQSNSPGNEPPNEAATSTSDENIESETSGENRIAGTRNPFRLAVLKLGMTELRWTSPLNYEKRDGEYVCAMCGSSLFDSKGKYDSGSGWPSFWRTAADDQIALKKEWDGRVECSCRSCGGHLGHIFMDGPRRDSMSRDELEAVPNSDPKGGVTGASRLPRFCVNGASLRFLPRSD